MKRIITLSILCFAAVAMFAQMPALKVTDASNTCLSCDDTDGAKIRSRGTSQVELAIDAAVGNADFTYQIGGLSKGQIRYNVGQGITYNLDDAGAGSGGVGNANSVLFLSSTGTKFVGVGTRTPTVALDVVGDIKATGMVTGSDKRLKNNIVDLDYGLEEVLKMSPKTYTYNGLGGTKAGKEKFGLIAQEFRKVIPELVSSYKHTVFQDQSQEEIDLEKEEKVKRVDEFLQIETGAIPFVLINAIKDQQSIIEGQNERIAKLESLVEDLLATNGSVQERELNIEGANADLSQNTPNPFNGETTIGYFIPQNAKTAKIDVFNANGALIETLSIDHTGEGQLNLSAQGLPTGTYSYVLSVDSKQIKANKMILQN